MTTLLKSNPWLRLLSDSVFDRSTADFWLQRINPLWSTEEMRGRITQRQQISDDMYALTIQCNRQMDFGLAGQHHPVFVEINGIRYERNYSLTRLDPQHVALHVKHVAGGLVSTWLCEQAQIGDIIRFGAPYGEVEFPHFQSQRLAFLAAGSGITPVYSLLHDLHVTKCFADYQIHLLYWVSKQGELAFFEQFQQWQAQYPNFKVDYICTREPATANDPLHTRLSAQHVAQIDTIEDVAVFACGPSGFVETAQSLTMNAKQFQGEALYFSTPNVSDTASTAVEYVDLHLTRSNKHVQIKKGESILSALEAENIRPQHGCRMGICNKCACQKVSGSTQHIANKQQNHEAHQSLRICVNSAQSDLELDL